MRENDGDGDFIPKQPIIDHLEKIKQKNKDKVNKYKSFAIDLKNKYKVEQDESKKHYSNFIKTKQKQTDDLFHQKEDLYYHLKLANEEAQKELIDVKNKLF